MSSPSLGLVYGVFSMLLASGCALADGGTSTGEVDDLAASAQFVAAPRSATAVGSSKRSDCSSPSIEGVGFLSESTPFSWALGISADGTTVTGYSDVDGTTRAYRYSDGTIESLGAPPDTPIVVGRGVSADGSLIAGYANTPDGTRPFLWRDGQMSLLDIHYASALDLSDDGKVIVGGGVIDGTNQAFRWSEQRGLETFGTLGGAISEAIAVDWNGSAIAGTVTFVNGAVTTQAFVWKRGGGATVLSPPEGFTQSAALGISSNGKVVVGWLQSGSTRYAARWTKKDGWVQLDTSPSEAAAASHDGSVIAGFSYSGTGMRPTLWQEGLGTAYVDDLLAAAGVSLSEWSLLREVNSLSADGKAIAGSGFNAAGQYEAWLACLP